MGEGFTPPHPSYEDSCHTRRASQARCAPAFHGFLRAAVLAARLKKAVERYEGLKRAPWRVCDFRSRRCGGDYSPTRRAGRAGASLPARFYCRYYLPNLTRSSDCRWGCCRPTKADAKRHWSRVDKVLRRLSTSQPTAAIKPRPASSAPAAAPPVAALAAPAGMDAAWIAGSMSCTAAAGNAGISCRSHARLAPHTGTASLAAGLRCSWLSLSPPARQTGAGEKAVGRRGRGTPAAPIRLVKETPWHLG